MQIVIDIPDFIYTEIRNITENTGIIGHNAKALYNAIYHGTPLPKGHGRLVDIDLLRNQVSHDEREAFSKHQVWLLLSVHNKKIPTIIEADKEVDG